MDLFTAERTFAGTAETCSRLTAADVPRGQTNSARKSSALFGVTRPLLVRNQGAPRWLALMV